MKGKYKIIAVILSVCLFLGIFLKYSNVFVDAADGTVIDGVHIWTTYCNYAVMQNPEDMVGDEIVPPTELSANANLRLDVTMGRGETEGTQIILSPTVDVTSYDLTVQALQCGDETLDVSDVSVYNQYYINAEHPDTQKFRAVPTGWCPDMLVPFEKAKEYGENTVAKGKNQGITIEFTTESTTKPGVYTGVFILTVNGKNIEIPVSVDVRDIDLGTTHDLGTTAAAMGDVNTETYEMLMNDYRICCMYAPQAQGSPKSMVEAVKKYWDNPRFTNYDIPNVDAMTYKAFVKELAKASTDLDHNYLTKAICYLQNVDESSDYASVISYVQSYRAKGEEVKQELAEYFSDTALKEAVFSAIDNIIIYATSNTYDKSMTAADYACQENKYTLCMNYADIKTQAAFEEYANESYTPIWTYANFGFPSTNGCLNQYRYSMRYLGWNMARRDMAGYLFWEMNLTSSIYSDRTTIERYSARNYYDDSLSFLNDSEDYEFFANGDGAQIYPAKRYGEPDRWYGTMRLASYRDGVEDHEALYQLEQIYNQLRNKYQIIDAEYDFDEIMDWVYNRGLSNETSCYLDDGSTVLDMRNIVFDLYDMAQTEGLLLSKLQLNKTTANLEFFTTAETVTWNGETIIGSSNKYSKTFDINTNPTFIIGLDDTQVKADIFGLGTLTAVTLDTVSDFVVVSDDDISVTCENNVAKFTRPNSWFNSSCVEKLRLKASLFDKTDVFDVFFVTMHVKVQTTSAQNSGIPLKINLYQEDIDKAEVITILELPPTTSSGSTFNKTHTSEADITFRINKEDLAKADAIELFFQDFHNEEYSVVKHMEISEVYYTTFSNVVE